MTTSQARWGRLDRLAGNGSSEAGIDLASLFRVILNQIQDSTEAVPASALAGPAQAAVSNHARVEHWYGQFSDDPWGALLTDALGQLEACRLIAASDGGWQIGPAFATGKRLVVVPARSRKNQSVGVILYPADERAARGEAEKRRMEVTSLASSLRESGSGLRPLTAEHVEALTQSMRDFDFRKEFPILIDQHGRILDGRHRQAAARKAGIPESRWPIRKVDVASDEEAVGLAILVNVQRGWTQAERTRIDRVLQAAGLTMEGFGRALGTAAKRELIKSALLADASRSNRLIAEVVGASDPTVGVVRDELAKNSQVHIYEFTTARTGKHSVNCWCGEGEAEPAQKESRTRTGTKKPVTLPAGQQARFDARVADGAPVADLMDEFSLTETPAKRLRTEARTRLAVAAQTPPTPEPPHDFQFEEEEHEHDWGPWLRECRTCDEIERGLAEP